MHINPQKSQDLFIKNIKDMTFNQDQLFLFANKAVKHNVVSLAFLALITTINTFDHDNNLNTNKQYEILYNTIIIANRLFYEKYDSNNNESMVIDNLEENIIYCYEKFTSFILNNTDYIDNNNDHIESIAKHCYNIAFKYNDNNEIKDELILYNHLHRLFYCSYQLFKCINIIDSSMLALQLCISSNLELAWCKTISNEKKKIIANDTLQLFQLYTYQSNPIICILKIKSYLFATTYHSDLIEYITFITKQSFCTIQLLYNIASLCKELNNNKACLYTLELMIKQLIDHQDVIDYYKIADTYRQLIVLSDNHIKRIDYYQSLSNLLESSTHQTLIIELLQKHKDIGQWFIRDSWNNAVKLVRLNQLDDALKFMSLTLKFLHYIDPKNQMLYQRLKKSYNKVKQDKQLITVH